MRYLLRISLVLIFIIALSHGAYTIYRLHHFFYRVRAEKLALNGIVIGVPHSTVQSTAFLLKTAQGVFKLNWYGHNLAIIPGQNWHLWVKLKSISFFANEGEFNYQSYLQHEGIVGIGYVLPSADNHLLGFQWYAAFIDYIRFRYEERLLRITHNLDKQGVLLALVLGDKALLNNKDKIIFTHSGISYFMVISGLHIVLFALFCTYIVRLAWALVPRLCLWLPAEQAGLVAGLVFSLLYGLMAGALVPTQRAVIMLWIVGLAKLCYQQVSSMRAWLYAFLLVLVWNPYVIFSVAFWLSFMAVFFLIGIFGGRLRPLNWWQEWFLPQWVMFWALLPIIVYVFNQVSLLAIFTNLISVPLMLLLIIPLALAGALLMLCSNQLALFFFQMSDWLLRLLLQGLSYFAFSNYWGFFSAKISFITLLLAMFGVITIFFAKAWPGRYLGWLLLIPLIYPIRPELPLGRVIETKITTANGIALLIKTQQHVVLMQKLTNIRQAHQDLRYVIEPFLTQQGIKHIDLWVINSAANYNQLTALQNDWQAIGVDKIATQHPFKIYDSRFISCVIPRLWHWDQVRLSLNRNSENSDCELTVDSIQKSHS